MDLTISIRCYCGPYLIKKKKNTYMYMNIYSHQLISTNNQYICTVNINSHQLVQIIKIYMYYEHMQSSIN